MAKTTTKTKPAPASAAEGEAPSRSKTKLVIAGVVAGLLLGGGAYFFLFAGGDDAQATEVPAAAQEGEIVEVDELTVNVKGEEIHYARVGFAVVLSAEATAEAVSPDFPLLKDAAISEISAFTPGQLRTPEGGDALRAALSSRADELWPDGEVLRVVLTSLIIQ